MTNVLFFCAFVVLHYPPACRGRCVFSPFCIYNQAALIIHSSLKEFSLHCIPLWFSFLINTATSLTVKPFMPLSLTYLSFVVIIGVTSTCQPAKCHLRKRSRLTKFSITTGASWPPTPVTKGLWRPHLSYRWVTVISDNAAPASLHPQ